VPQGATKGELLQYWSETKKRRMRHVKRALLLYHAWNNQKALVGDILDEHHIAYEIINVEEEPIVDPTQYAAVIAFGEYPESL
jgi:hypothetical protein